MFLYRLTDAFRKAKVEYALVGGYAVALHGAVRGTVDIDLVLALRRSDFIKAEALLLKLGLQSRLPVTGAEVFDYREEYVKNRHLIAWSFYNPGKPSEVVDIVITHDLSRMKTTTVRSAGHGLTLLALPDLIRMKEAAGRPQDLEDVRALKILLSERSG